MRSRPALSGSIVLVTFASLVLVTTASCGSGIAPASEGGEGGFGDTDGSDVGDGASLRDAADTGLPPVADAPFPCGKTTCRGDQYCLQPCCGGPAPQCIPADDAGGCPAGFHPAVCQGSGMQGCEADPCTPAPPSCIDDVKQGGGCQLHQSTRYLDCFCA